MSDPIDEKDQTAAAEATEETETPEPEVEAVAAEPVEADVVDETEAEAEPFDTEEAEEDEELVAGATEDEAEETEEAAEEVAPAAASARSRPARKPRTAPKPAAPKQYAVIKTGGKQYRVSVGDTIAVERLTAEAGSEISLDEVLLIGGDGSTAIGTPLVPGASVSAQVDDHFRGEKIVVFKYKAKKRYRRRTGHRQELTHLTITGISN